MTCRQVFFLDQSLPLLGNVYRQDGFSGQVFKDALNYDDLINNKVYNENVKENTPELKSFTILFGHKENGHMGM